MKLDPIQSALIGFATSKPTARDLKNISIALRTAASHLADLSRGETGQDTADALHAGAMCLTSLADEIAAGGDTDASIDYRNRCATAAVSFYIRKSKELRDGNPYDDFVKRDE